MNLSTSPFRRSSTCHQHNISSRARSTMLQPSCLARGHQLQIHQWPEVLHRASQLLGQLAWLLELVLQLGKGGVAPQGMQLFCDDFFHHTLLQVPGVGYSTANPGNEAMFSFHSPACHHHLVLSVRFTQVQEPVVFLDHFPTNSIPQPVPLQNLFRYRWRKHP